MKYALVNPNWSFNGSVYFGCREPHLPLEYGYAKALLECEDHEVIVVDAHMEGLAPREIRSILSAFDPDFTVVTTAPTYLFWRCPPPELRAPGEVASEVRGVAGILIAVGPHGSTTPAPTAQKLNADTVIRGEFEEVLPMMAQLLEDGWEGIPSLYYADAAGERNIRTLPHEADLSSLPALHWPDAVIQKHRHHHHRFDAPPRGPGAEMETSRGCPYRCTFCARDNFRKRYRKRPLPVVLDELDGLLARGVEYVYFIDETFMPDEALLYALCDRRVKFGIQTRIDLWSPQMIELLGRAGCVSIEAGVESITDEGLRSLHKSCGVPLQELTERLIMAKRHVSFVQANLISTGADGPERIEEWRSRLHRYGVWANKPVPLFPYPGSALYAGKWGVPDDLAWERAHEYYLASVAEFSDIQEQSPLPLSLLEMRPEQ